jgi:hypothetical protein
MQVLLFWSAAALTLVTFAVHTFVGGVFVARPLLADTSLPKASKWLNYYCWHIATVTILAMAAAFVYSAARPDRLELAISATLLAAIFAPLSVAVARKGGIHPLRFPSTSLFTGIALLGAGALFAG